MMKSLVLVLVAASLSLGNSNPLNVSTTTPTTTSTTSSTTRSPTQYDDPIRELISKQMKVQHPINITSEMITMDTRTPPRIKQRNKIRDNLEKSHAGVAIPVDPEEIQMDEATKKLNFYKIERTTTNSGLSTWILLSGQSSTKPPKKTTITTTTARPDSTTVSVPDFNETILVQQLKPIKPVFKKRTTTTRKPLMTKLVTLTTPPTIETSTTNKEPTTKLTKIKASILQNAIKQKISSTPISRTGTTQTTTLQTPTTTKTVSSTSDSVNSTEIDGNGVDSQFLPVEAKESETDLKPETKTKRTPAKRKKNKNRRRRPSSKTGTDLIKNDKLKNKESEDVSSQIYSYLSREVMPTVGVGLVGLVVTAGLAGYFLYPFGVARRSYEVPIDRRDKDNGYYYNDQYSGGIAEEEAIGKVIAGMPSNTLYGNTYKSPTSRDSSRYTHGTVESVPYTPDYEPITYKESSVEQPAVQPDSRYDQNKFVVGSIPKEEVTPAAVPEHGPRMLRVRRETDLDNEIGGEKFNEVSKETTTTTTTTTTMRVPTSTTKKNERIGQLEPQEPSILNLIRDLLRIKLDLGMQLVQNASRAISTYVSQVQRRFDEEYKRNKNLKQN